MNNFVVIFSCLITGHLCKKLHNFQGNTAQILNSFVIYLSLPALILSTVPKLFFTISLSGKWWVPVSLAWINFIFSFLMFSFLAKRLKWSSAKTGAIILTAGLGNTSFVGFPILEALLGKEALPIGVLIDQPGSFLVLSTLGIIVAAFFSGAKVDAGFLVKRVGTFPPFIALILSLVWAASGLAGFDFLVSPLEKIAGTLVPVALFSVGFQLKFDWKIIHRKWLPLSLGLAFKLILTPVLVFLFYSKAFNMNELTLKVIVLESAMATMITSAVVAQDFHLDSELANMMVSLSIPLSLVTVPLWNIFLFN